MPTQAAPSRSGFASSLHGIGVINPSASSRRQCCAPWPTAGGGARRGRRSSPARCRQVAALWSPNLQLGSRAMLPIVHATNHQILQSFRKLWSRLPFLVRHRELCAKGDLRPGRLPSANSPTMTTTTSATSGSPGPPRCCGAWLRRDPCGVRCASWMEEKGPVACGAFAARAVGHRRTSLHSLLRPS